MLTHPLLIEGDIFTVIFIILNRKILNHKNEREVQHWLNNLRGRADQESLRPVKKIPSC